MAIGFDFGTANCSVARIEQDKVKAIPLVGDETNLPSTLSAPTRESITEYLYRFMDIKPQSQAEEALLRNALETNREEGIVLKEQELKFGHAATDYYLEDPGFAYYVKSPKSFLGKLGLQASQLIIFEQIICVMMANIKRSTEAYLGEEVTQAIIGRPIHFHHSGNEASNTQAIQILQNAAHKAGFKEVGFEYEPVAAGMEYEASLTGEQKVLVVDIGGGTTDCSFLTMGPTWANKEDRKDSVLAHSGKMVGGNDLDIHLAFQQFMPEFGKETRTQSGLPLPTRLFWEAMAINDIDAQRKFYAFENLKQLNNILRDAAEAEKVKRLINLYQNTLSHSLIREAEQTKIILGNQEQTQANLNLLSEQVDIDVNASQVAAAITTPIRQIQGLIKEALTQASCTPDKVFITGGSARSPILRAAVREVLPQVEMVSGDFHGSVTAGLARRARLCFG